MIAASPQQQYTAGQDLQLNGRNTQQQHLHGHVVQDYLLPRQPEDCNVLPHLPPAT
jgi:hypothetical protein